MTRVTFADNMALVFYFFFWWIAMTMVSWNLAYVWHAGTFSVVNTGLAALVLSYATVWLDKG